MYLLRNSIIIIFEGHFLLLSRAAHCPQEHQCLFVTAHFVAKKSSFGLCFHPS